MNRQTEEIDAFCNVWKNGYYEGDPFDINGKETTGQIGLLNRVYQTCIIPYVSESTTVLEIGPGRGTFTKCFLNAKSVVCVDAKPAKDNCFWEHVGETYKEKITYFKVEDFSLSFCNNNSIDYVFSYGCMCHISPALNKLYFESLFRVMSPGAVGFIMISDMKKFCAFSGVKTAMSHFNHSETIIPGRWYENGTEHTTETLDGIGFDIISKDIGINKRDPIIHFVKPIGSKLHKFISEPQRNSAVFVYGDGEREINVTEIANKIFNREDYFFIPVQTEFNQFFGDISPGKIKTLRIKFEDLTTIILPERRVKDYIFK